MMKNVALADMEFEIAKIVVRASSRALRATWGFERLPLPPRKHENKVYYWPTEKLVHEVVLSWDSDESVRNMAADIEQWLQNRFADDHHAYAYYYNGLLVKDREKGSQEMFWRFQFAHQNDALEFKLRWG